MNTSKLARLILIFSPVLCWLFGSVEGRAQTVAVRNWIAPDGCVGFNLPYRFRKQRVRETGDKIAFWKSKDGNAQIELFVSDVESDEDRRRSRWEQEFLDSVRGSLSFQDFYQANRHKVWFTRARSKSGDHKRSWMQSTLILDDKAYQLRASFVPPADESALVKSVRSLTPIDKTEPESDADAAEEKPRIFNAPGGDFTMMVPVGVGEVEVNSHEMIRQWNSTSFDLVFSIAVFKQPAPQCPEWVPEENWKSVFQKGIIAGTDAKDPQLTEMTRNGREMWTLKFRDKFLGFETTTESLMFRVGNNFYAIVIGYDEDDPKSIEYCRTVIESISFRPVVPPDDGKILGVRTGNEWLERVEGTVKNFVLIGMLGVGLIFVLVVIIRSGGSHRQQKRTGSNKIAGNQSGVKDSDTHDSDQRFDSGNRPGN